MLINYFNVSCGIGRGIVHPNITYIHPCASPVAHILYFHCPLSLPSESTMPKTTYSYCVFTELLHLRIYLDSVFFN